MRFKTLIAALVLPFATGLVPAETATAAPPLPPLPTANAALAAGNGNVAMNPVVVVERRGGRRYYNRGRYRTVRRVYYRNGRRVVVVRRVRY